MKEITRFDLEQAIMDCWGTEHDIALIADSIGDGHLEGDVVDVDDMLNVLVGVQKLHNLRCAKLMDIFSHLVEKGQIT